MLVLPIPMIGALLLGFLTLMAFRRGGMHPLLLGLLMLCALQSALIALVQHYGVTALRPLQPVGAAMIPPLAWLAFVGGTNRPISRGEAMAHALGPLFVAFCVGLVPQVLDLVLPVLFVGYGAAILLAVGRGGDSLPLARLESGDLPHRLWQAIAVILLASALSDALIVADQILADGRYRLIIVSGFASLNLAVIGILALSGALVPGESGGAAVPALIDPERDAAILDRLDQMMRERRPFLDPDLTLSQLSRRLTVPAKQLSAAINRGRGENVSRLVNRHRVEHACTLLREGRSVTSVMFECGFNTKSNFNREFLRVTGLSPSEWVAQQSEKVAC